MVKVGCFLDLSPMTDAKEGKFRPEEFLDMEPDGLSFAYCLRRSCFEDFEERDHHVREGCSARRAEDMKRQEKERSGRSERERRGGETKTGEGKHLRIGA